MEAHSRRGVRRRPSTHEQTGVDGYRALAIQVLSIRHRAMSEVAAFVDAGPVRYFGPSERSRLGSWLCLEALCSLNPVRAIAAVCGSADSVGLISMPG